MKKLAKSLVVSILNWQVRRLRARNTFKTVAVVGSIGKTSTKLAIAQVLKTELRTQYQDGNYNDVVTVPLVYFGLPEPSLLNPFAWFRTFMRIEQQLKQPYPYDVIVLELGTDFPGNIAQFAPIVQADIAVVTALTPEHMEYFGSIEAVAAEELSVAAFSKELLVNRDLCPVKYLEGLKVPHETFGKAGGKFDSQAQAYSVGAAKAVAKKFGLNEDEISEGVKLVNSVAGRMRRLKGLNGSLILDDTYNASPEAAKLALDTLYEAKGQRKIAILGNMNEMGDYSQKAHEAVGRYCDPKQLELVVTIGPEANEYLAPAAKAQGCEVVATESPYLAARAVKERLDPGTVLLAKGSQNRVFAEEAVKLLLADRGDASNLVRQSDYWLKVKTKQFGQPPESA